MITGKKDNLSNFYETLKGRGIRIFYFVNAPVHTPYVKDAAQAIMEDVDVGKIQIPEIRLIANSSAEFLDTPEQLGIEMYSHLIKPVLWRQTISRLAENGIERYVVIGPDKKAIMGRLIKETDPMAKVLTCNSAESLERLVDMMN